MPKVDRFRDTYNLSHCVKFNVRFSTHDVEKWIEENIKGHWDYFYMGLGESSFFFEDEEDAAAFKLKWL